MTKSVVTHDVLDIALKLYEGAGTPRAQTCFMLARAGEWEQLVNLRATPSDYNNSFHYRSDAIVTDFLRKCQGLPTGIDTTQVAVDNFWSAERQCYHTNERLTPYLFGGGDVRIAEFIQRVRKKVSQVLGPCPDFLEGRFGPGATFSDRGQFCTILDKMSSSPSFTPEAWPYLIHWSGLAWAKACANREISPTSVRGNRFTTVPKDATKDRGICIEPSINLYFQLGYGKYIRGKLKKVGIDLVDGQDIHRQVACEASTRGHLATIDLSNASDTVSNALVELLLPRKWFAVLNSLRSRFTLIGEKWVMLEKFSSMGNGFTFELETLIFWALVSTACGDQALSGEDLFVYGDDIICPTEHASNVIKTLQFFGFTPNSKKTFVSGKFRESCGGDYFNGQNVRPFYLKELPSEPQDFIRLANGLRTLADHYPNIPFRFDLAFRAWLRCLDCVPQDIRNIRGPKDLGDLVIRDDQFTWSCRIRNGVRYFRCYRPVGKFIRLDRWRPEVVLAAVLYGGCTSRGVQPRNGVSGYKHGWVPWS